MIKAYYGLRSGGSGGRSVSNAAEAEKLLRGGYGVTTVHLENEHGEEVGCRWRLTENGKTRWAWYYEQDAFNA